MTKGSLLKWYLPKGIMKVVSGRDSGDNSICQKLLLASNLVNTVAPASCARASSTLGIGCTSHSTFSLSGFRSTHSLLHHHHHPSTPRSGVFYFQNHSH